MVLKLYVKDLYILEFKKIRAKENVHSRKYTKCYMIYNTHENNCFFHPRCLVYTYLHVDEHNVNYYEV